MKFLHKQQFPRAESHYTSRLQVKASSPQFSCLIHKKWNCKSSQKGLLLYLLLGWHETFTFFSKATVICCQTSDLLDKISNAWRRIWWLEILSRTPHPQNSWSPDFRRRARGGSHWGVGHFRLSALYQLPEALVVIQREGKVFSHVKFHLNAS